MSYSHKLSWIIITHKKALHIVIYFSRHQPVASGPCVHDGGGREGAHVLLRAGRLQHGDTVREAAPRQYALPGGAARCSDCIQLKM